MAPGRCGQHCQLDDTVTVGPVMVCVGTKPPRRGQRVMPGRRYIVGREQEEQVAVLPKHMVGVGDGWCRFLLF